MFFDIFIDAEFFFTADHAIGDYSSHCSWFDLDVYRRQKTFRQRDRDIDMFRHVFSTADDFIGSFLSAIHLTDIELISFRVFFE